MSLCLSIGGFRWLEWIIWGMGMVCDLSKPWSSLSPSTMGFDSISSAEAATA